MIEYLQGNQSQAATLLCGGIRHPPDERKEGMPMYVTYQDLVQIGIFIVALVAFAMRFSRVKENSRQLLPIVDGC